MYDLKKKKNTRRNSIKVYYVLKQETYSSISNWLVCKYFYGFSCNTSKLKICRCGKHDRFRIKKKKKFPSGAIKIGKGGKITRGFVNFSSFSTYIFFKNILLNVSVVNTNSRFLLFLDSSAKNSRRFYNNRSFYDAPKSAAIGSGGVRRLHFRGKNPGPFCQEPILFVTIVGNVEGIFYRCCVEQTHPNSGA